MIEMRACPLLKLNGDSHIRRVEKDKRLDRYRVTCECGVCGPWSWADLYAQREWNIMPRAVDIADRRLDRVERLLAVMGEKLSELVVSDARDSQAADPG